MERGKVGSGGDGWSVNDGGEMDPVLRDGVARVMGLGKEGRGDGKVRGCGVFSEGGWGWVLGTELGRKRVGDGDTRMLADGKQRGGWVGSGCVWAEMGE